MNQNPPAHTKQGVFSRQGAEYSKILISKRESYAIIYGVIFVRVNGGWSRLNNISLQVILSYIIFEKVNLLYIALHMPELYQSWIDSQ